MERQPLLAGPKNSPSKGTCRGCRVAASRVGATITNLPGIISERYLYSGSVRLRSVDNRSPFASRVRVTRGFNGGADVEL